MPLILLTIHRLQAVDMSLVLDVREILVQGDLLVERSPGSEGCGQDGCAEGLLGGGARLYRILEVRQIGCVQSADHATGSEKKTIFLEVSAPGARSDSVVRERRRAGAKNKEEPDCARSE